MSDLIYTGCVKWFNTKTGFGFITIVSNSQCGNDIFVHHKALSLSNQYKYLLKGEYVEFKLKELVNEKHSVQAVDVTGICGGNLLCQTLQNEKDNNLKYKKSKKSQNE